MTLLRTAFANAALARVLGAWAASSLSVWAFTILFALAAYDAGGAAALGLAVVVRTLPAALAAPYGALLADRRSRRAVLVASVVARVLLLAVLGLAVMAQAPFAVVCVLGALFTIAGVVHGPAQSALMAGLARSPAELAAGNVVVSSLEYVGFLSGSLLAGVAAGLVGLDVALLVAVAPLVVAALLVLGVPADLRPEALPDTAGEAAGSEMLAGLRTVLDDRRLGLLTGLFAADMVVQGLVDVLLVLVAIEMLGIGQSGVGWLNAGWGVGGLVGGVAALVLLGRGQLARGLVAGCLLAGVPLVALAAAGGAPLAIVLLVVVGLGFALSEIALKTFTQRLAPDDVLARVFGLHETLLVGMSAFGSLLAVGSVALVGIGPTLVWTGLVLPALVLLARRALLALESSAAVPERPFALLRATPLFAPLPLATVETLAVRADVVDVEEHTAVIAEGDPGDAFYVIDEGTVEVSVRGVPVREQGPGDFFGEIALLHETVRTATVTAASPLRLVVVSRFDFLESIGAHARSTHEARTVAGERLAAGAA